MVEMKELKEYRAHGDSKLEVGDFLKKLETSLTAPNKSGKGKKTLLHPFNKPNYNLYSWKFKDWDYVSPKIKLPTMARGLFVNEDKKKIIVRGYDKFFNLDECYITKKETIKATSKGPYEVTLKTNGCILFISGLEDGSLIVCSKHSTGFRDENSKNHALQGQNFLLNQLKAKSIEPKELGELLYDLNITAVAEFCNDLFEEHVLQYTGDDAGLYLHGINFNIPEFRTFPMELVNDFAEKFGFKKTDYFVENDLDKLFEYFKECSKTGMYKNQEIEGFVVRSKDVANNAFFWKYKFEEPYLMYREWREATKRLLRVGNDITDSSLEKYNHITKNYLMFVHNIFSKNPLLGKHYLNGHGIIDLRKLYLGYIDKKGYELTKSKDLKNEKLINNKGLDENIKMSNEKLNENIDELIEFLKQFDLTPKNDLVLNDNENNIKIITKYVIIPVATIGCGKTTVGLTLMNLFPSWGIIQNDNLLKHKSFKNRFERKTLQWLSGDDDILNEESINDEILNFNPKIKSKKFEKSKKISNKNNVIFMDRNNHMFRERKQLFDLLKSLKNEYFDEESIKYDFKFIGLNFLPLDSTTSKETKEKVWNLTYDRIISRGCNHQSIKIKDENSKKEAEEVMKGFIERFQFLNPNKLPDSNFDEIINLNVFDNDSKSNVKTILNTLREKYPEMLQNEKISDKSIDEAFTKAMNYEPKVIKTFGKKSQPKPSPKKISKFTYYGLKISNSGIVLKSINDLLTKKLEGENFLQTLVENQRIINDLHVTLAHKFDKNEKTLFKKLEDSSIEKISMDIKLIKLVWEFNKIVTVEVEISKIHNNNYDISLNKKHYHITIGTTKEVKAVYSNNLLNFVEDLKDGTYDGGVKIIHWDDEIILYNLPLMGF